MSTYDLLLQKLDGETCALILGPEFIFANGEDVDLVESQKKFLEQNSAATTAFLKSDGFFCKMGESIKPSDRDDIVSLISSFYQQQPMHAYYTKLADLPFKVIISLSPDDFMERAFEKIGKPCEVLFYQKGDFYKKDVPANKFKRLQEKYAPPKEATVIINLLGIVKRGDSLILTYEDFFEFMRGLLKSSDLKLDLQSTLEDIDAFLFLGFKYNKWYLNFIFFLIQHIRGDRNFRKKAVYFTKDESDSLEFYKNAFNFEFDKGEQTSEFIDNLYQRAEELIYRPKGSNGNGNPTKIAYISSNPDKAMPTGADDEYDSISTALQIHTRRSDFQLIDAHRTSTISQLIQQLANDAPNILFISAHGNEKNELLFKGETQQSTRLTEAGIKEIFQNLTSKSRENLECIVFSCCESDKIAEMVKGYVKYSIGIEGAWPVDLTPAFAKGFFSTFFNEKNYEDAFNIGMAYVKTYVDGCPDQKKKQLQSIPFKPRLFK